MTAKHLKGFSMIELVVVVTIIGILALLGIPGLKQANDRTRATTAANDLRVFTDAVELYSTSAGGYPVNMTYNRMPTEVSGYLPPAWKNGSYNWFYVNLSSYTYLYVYNLSFTPEQAVQLDTIIDDGNVATGNVRMALNGSGLIYLFRSGGDNESL